MPYLQSRGIYPKWEHQYEAISHKKKSKSGHNQGLADNTDEENMEGSGTDGEEQSEEGEILILDAFELDD